MPHVKGPEGKLPSTVVYDGAQLMIYTYLPRLRREDRRAQQATATLESPRALVREGTEKPNPRKKG